MFFLKKDAQNISRRTLSIRNIFYIVHVYTEISVWSWKISLKSWKSHGKVLVIHWSEPCIWRSFINHKPVYLKTVLCEWTTIKWFFPHIEKLCNQFQMGGGDIDYQYKQIIWTSACCLEPERDYVLHLCAHHERPVPVALLLANPKVGVGQRSETWARRRRSFPSRRKSRRRRELKVSCRCVMSPRCF